jgi:acyl-CoA synthetase (AMP-forming)/AMP-acid ligase II
MDRPDLTSTARYIAWYARHDPETTAIIEGGSPLNYRGLAAALIRFVRALEELRVGPGMLLGLLMSQRYTHLLLLLACEVTGATAVAISEEDLSSGDDIVRCCDLILTDLPPGPDFPAKTIAISPEWLARLVPSSARAEDLFLLDREIAPAQMMRIVRSSGTTGRQKAMAMSNATQQMRIVRTIERVAHDILPKPRFLCMYGLAVGSVYARVLGVLQHGGTILFDAFEHALALIEAGAVNYANFSLGDIERAVRRATPPYAVGKMHIEVFGATVPRLLRQQIRERLNANITNKYSSNETNPIAIIDDDNVGTLCPGVEARIVDETGHEKAAGEPGIIRVRTETMVHGYFNDPALTEASFIDGWFQTSDFGAMPAPGKLILLGRADNMLNIGGVKIAPSPVEARIKSIDGIGDAVVISVASEYDVSLLMVAVEIDGDPPAAGLTEAIGMVAADYAPAAEIMIMRRFPRTDTGKIKRHEIAAAYRQRRLAERIAAAAD